MTQLTAAEDAFYPDNRITCGKCARTSETAPYSDNRCPRLPKYPADHKHRCWYFQPIATHDDQRPGHEIYATEDLEQRAYMGWKDSTTRNPYRR